MCDEEYLDVESVLNLPANRFRLKEKQTEQEIENLKILSDKLNTLKQDSHFYFEKSFERIFNDLDLRWEG